jgi:hypothetical protein
VLVAESITKVLLLAVIQHPTKAARNEQYNQLYEAAMIRHYLKDTFVSRDIAHVIALT